MARTTGLVWIAACLALAACAPEPEAAPAPAGEPAQLAGGVTRLDLRFPCSDATCAGWLFLPSDAPRAPVVVMGHGFAGTRDLALPHFALHFAQAGVAAFVFDYRHFGASGGTPRQLVDPWQQLEDWAAALRFVRTLPELDPLRVAVWGTSQGAGQALIAAHEDGGVRALVGQVPLVDSGVEGEATFYGIPWVVRLLLTAWADLAVSLVGGGPLLIPAFAPAGGFGMIVDDAAYAAAQSLPEPGSSHRNAVVAHSVFTYDEWNPAPHARALKLPILLVAARGDRFAPFSAVEALARDAPNVRVEEIDGDHFDVYVSPRRERAAELAARFLALQLRGASAPPPRD